MKIKTNVKAGGLNLSNHNETLQRAAGLKVKTFLRTPGLKVKTNVKAGFTIKKTTDQASPA